MKKSCSILLVVAIICSLVACGGNLVGTNENLQNNTPSDTDEHIENTENVEEIESEASANQKVTISIAPSEVASTITITGAFAEYFVQNTNNSDMHFVVQLENESGGFAEFRMDAHHAWFFYYTEEESETVKGTSAEESVTFVYPNTLFNMDDVTSISVYIAEGDGFPERYECIPVSVVSIEREAPQTMAHDEHDIVGVYVDVFSDSSAILEMSTDEYGYVAKLNGRDYALTTNEQDSGDYIAYIGTADSGERCCVNVSDDKVLSISEYYGEPEMRYTFEYAPLYTTEFYGYDKALNREENPVKYEFDGKNMQITIDDTYTTGWVSLDEIHTASNSLAFLQLTNFPMTSLENGEVYFLNLKAFPKKNDWWEEMSIQAFSIYKSELIEGGYYPYHAFLADTVIADVASESTINDIISSYTSMEGRDAHYFEITENEIILDEKILANMNVQELYANILSGNEFPIYDDDKITHFMTISEGENSLHITMQEYGTTSTLFHTLGTSNYKPKSLDIIVQKQ